MVLLLSRRDLESILDMRETIEAVEEGFRQFFLKTIDMPLRHTILVEEYDGTVLVMPAYIGGMKALGLKLVTVYPQNPKIRRLPTILGTMLLNDVETGKLLAIMDGTFITAMRTGAVSGVATKYLSREDSEILGIFGAGVQARTQLWAVSEVRNIKEVKIYDTDVARSDEFCEEMSRRLGLEVYRVDIPKDAVRGSDILITATTSKNPLFRGEWVELGTHINGVGSHHPDVRELDEVILKRSKVVVDSREAVLREAGDLMIPISEGVLSADQVYAELSEVVTGNKTSRTSREEITLFKSVGLALQDVATASRVYVLAKEKGVGKTVEI